MNPYLVSGDETEIDLLDLCRYLLRRIGWILLVGIICAGLVSACQYIMTKHSDPKAVNKEETKYELELAMYEQESELITTFDESTLELIRKQEEYLSTSPYMQLDPYHVWKAQTLVRVTSHNKDFPAYHFEELYKFELSHSDAFEEFANEMNTEAAYLRKMFEILSVEVPVDLGDDTSDIILRDEDYEDRTSSKIFVIQTLGNTRENAMELMEILLSELEISHQKYEKDYPHELQVFSTSCEQTVDTVIRDSQRDYMTNSQSLISQMKDNTSKGTQLSKPKEKSSVMKNLLKYGLLGFVVGILLMCVWFAVRYIRNDKLVDYKDIGKKGFILKDLGSLTNQGAAMAAANIRNFAGDRKRLFLTGMSGEDGFDKACESLKEYLSEYEIVCARDVIHDPSSREKLLDCDAAVLVEQKGVTQYSSMKDEVIFLVNAGKEIVGIVII